MGRSAGRRRRRAGWSLRVQRENDQPDRAGDEREQAAGGGKRGGRRPGDRGERFREGRDARGGLPAAGSGCAWPERGTRAGSWSRRRPRPACRCRRWPRSAMSRRRRAQATNGANASTMAPEHRLDLGCARSGVPAPVRSPPGRARPRPRWRARRARRRAGQPPSPAPARAGRAPRCRRRKPRHSSSAGGSR